MLLVSEAERRVDRGRQIVARQRELVAKVGGVLPIAVELLKTYEKTLNVLEGVLANRRRHELATGSTLHSSGVPPAPVLDAADDAACNHEEQMREVARIMEILRQGGYHCEPAQDTLH